MSKFDPIAAGFVLLPDFTMAETLEFFEYRNHVAVDGKANLLRLNVYLTRDGDFVTIWFGLIEPFMAEGQFEPPITDLDFHSMYNQPLFRGYITSQSEASVILNSLRLNGYGTPQVLLGAPHDIRCEQLT
jgi:hypothetical protein